MLPLIPAAIATTIVMGYVLTLHKPEETSSYPIVIAENIYLQHEMTYRHIKAEGLLTGTFTEMYPPGIQPIGDWETRAIQNGRRAAVVTYQRVGGPVSEEALHRALAYLSDNKLGNLRNSSAGLYKIEGSSSVIGSMDVSSFAIPFDTGTPAIVSIVGF